MSTYTAYCLVDGLDLPASDFALAKIAYGQIEKVVAKNFEGDLCWNVGLLITHEKLIIMDDPDNDKESWEVTGQDMKAKWLPEEYVTKTVREAMMAFCLDAEVEGLNVYFPDEKVMAALEALPTNELLQRMKVGAWKTLFTACLAENEAVLDPERKDLLLTAWKRFWDLRRFSTHYIFFERSQFKPFVQYVFDPFSYRFCDLRKNDGPFDDATDGIVLMTVRT